MSTVDAAAKLAASKPGQLARDTSLVNASIAVQVVHAGLQGVGIDPVALLQQERRRYYEEQEEKRLKREAITRKAEPPTPLDLVHDSDYEDFAGTQACAGGVLFLGVLPLKHARLVDR